MKQAANAAHNVGVVLHHVHARQFEYAFTEEEWRKTLAQKMAMIDPGVVFQAMVPESLYDQSVKVNHPSRTSHSGGAISDKLRTLVAMQRMGSEVEVRVGTGFGNQRQPPAASRGDWFRLHHEKNSIKPPGTAGIPAVRFTAEEDHLTKPTFMRKSRSFWISLNNTPVAKKGRIMVDDFPEAATMLNLAQNHPFWITARTLKQQQEDAELEERFTRRM